MFSVIIPLYNKELSISNTIQSVLNQTFQDFEIVIVNDGSTDNSVKEVEKFDDKRIRLIHQENKGVSDETQPTDTFLPLTTGLFEGLEVNLPNNYDKYLTALYGDYMKLPSEEERKTLHEILKFSLTE